MFATMVSLNSVQELFSCDRQQEAKCDIGIYCVWNLHTVELYSCTITTAPCFGFWMMLRVFLSATPAQHHGSYQAVPPSNILIQSRVSLP